MTAISRSLRAAATALALAACSPSDQPGGGSEPAPAITIVGVAEGAAYDPPVAIEISVDRGAYQATLDGFPYISGDTVRTAGAHVLSVTAQAGLAVASQTVHFTLRASPGGALIIRMFDLGANDAGGGGDAILVTDSSATGVENVMIDAGPAGVNASDPGFVERQLASLGVDTLAMLLLTHAHDDHYGGMPPILSSIAIRRFLYNGQVRTLSSYQAVLAQARAVADSVIVVSARRDYDLGASATPSHLTLIPPLATYLGTTTDDGDLLNDGSVGARLVLGTFTMLFTGDAEVEANAYWESAFADLIRGVTVLKVGHHGANNAIFDNGVSGASSWLDQTAPQISIVSGNGTTHPRINALARLLLQAGNRTYCTNVHGNIEIRVARSGTYTVTVARNAAQQCIPGSEATS